MSDAAARRRELRRRKILDNPEERKRKILGLSKSDEIAQNESDVTPTTPISNEIDVGKTTEQPDCIPEGESRPNSEEKDIGKITEQLKCMTKEESIPEIPTSTEKLPTAVRPKISSMDVTNPNFEWCSDPPLVVEQRPILAEPPCLPLFGNGIQSSLFSPDGSMGGGRNNLLNNNYNRNGSPEREENSDLYSSDLAPIILALFISLLITCNFGFFVSDSLAIPFILWELHRFIINRGNNSTRQNTSGLLTAALMLSGLQPTAVTKLLFFMSMFKKVSEDLALYLFTIVIWQLIITYPEYPEFPEMDSSSAVPILD